jgi:hypothetical protein
MLGAFLGAYGYKFLYTEGEKQIATRKPVEKIIHPPGSLGQGV